MTFGLVLLNLPTSDKRVLGLSDLAQNNIPAEATPEAPATFEPQTPPETSTPSETPAPAMSEPTTPEPSAITAETAPTPSPENTIQTILEPGNTLNFPENISQTTTDKAVEEDSRLEGVVDPETKNNLIVEIASSQVKNLDKLTDNNDNTSANFVIQRLNNEIETAISNLNGLPDDKKASVQQKLNNFCNNSDPTLRVAVLSVPEEIQQDIEITRGLCQAL